jgi:hypothetical protein
MTGKYSNPLKYFAIKLQRWGLRAILRGLVGWRPAEHYDDGYTILIACASRVGGMLATNLAVLAKQDRTHLRKIIVVFDRSRHEVGEDLEACSRSAFCDLPLEFHYYTPFQSWLLRKIGWGWAYAWLSWCIGTARAATRYVFIQDFDAFPLRPDVIEERYRVIREQAADFVGIEVYKHNGLIASDGLVITPEMMFDASWVRAQFKPIDVFNHVCMHRGRTVDFDTFLYVQSRSRKVVVAPVDERHLVHPGQVICDFTAMMTEARFSPRPNTNLFLIPYFLYLGGDTEAFRAALDPLARAPEVTICGRDVTATKITPPHAAWIQKQAYRLENAVIGGIRPEVEEYFESLARWAGRNETGAVSAQAVSSPRA